MALPAITDFIRYIKEEIEGTDWNANFAKIISFLTDGTYSFLIYSIQILQDITIGGNATVTGSVTATTYHGDGSNLTGLDDWRKNFIINGTCLIKNNADYTLVKDVYGESVDRFEGMATGTAVNAGTLTQSTSANCGETGYALKFSGVTLTGTGEIYLRHRLYSKDAVNFKDAVLSFATQIYQDTGSQVAYTITINKADVLNNFSAVTEIENSGALGVNSETETQIKIENVSVGDCTNGLEILIKAECGAITLKNFEFAELQLERAAIVSDFEYKIFENDVANDSFEPTTGALKEIVDTAQLIDGAVDEDKLGTGASFESAVTRYYSISGAAWQLIDPACTWSARTPYYFKTNTADTTMDYYAQDLHLPHGSTITDIKMYFYREAPSNVNDVVQFTVYKWEIDDNTPGAYQSLNLTTSTETGVDSIEIVGTSMEIDNINYKYSLQLGISCNSNINHAYFIGAEITYTVDKPLP